MYNFISSGHDCAWGSHMWAAGFCRKVHAEEGLGFIRFRVEGCIRRRKDSNHNIRLP